MVVKVSYQSRIKKVSGKNKGDVFIFALSTCVWCMKTKKLFKDLGVAYSYVDVDLLEGKAKEEASKEIMKLSGEHSFPTIIIDGKKVIQGFDEEAIRDFCGSEAKGH
jgi:glutaredoxin